MRIPYKQLFLLAGISTAVFLAMKYILPVAIPFLLAWVLVRLLHPAALWLEKRFRLSRAVAGGILLFLFAALLGAAFYLLGGALLRQGFRLAENFELYLKRARRFVKGCCALLEKNTGLRAQTAEQFVYDNLALLEERFQTYVMPKLLKNGFSFFRTFLEWLGAVLIVFVSYMLILKDYDQLRDGLKKWGVYERASRLNAAMQSMGGAWLRAQAVIILAVTVICVAGLWLLGYPYALILGIVVGLLDALPFVGTGTVLVPWGIFEMFAGKFWYGVGLTALFLAANTLREFLEPKLIGDRMGIYPIAMVAAVYAGIYLYGIAGVALGPISLMLIAEIYRGTRDEPEKSTVKSAAKNRENTGQAGKNGL